jgi:hypothetical protein
MTKDALFRPTFCPRVDAPQVHGKDVRLLPAHLGGRRTVVWFADPPWKRSGATALPWISVRQSREPVRSEAEPRNEQQSSAFRG